MLSLHTQERLCCQMLDTPHPQEEQDQLRDRRRTREERTRHWSDQAGTDQTTRTWTTRLSTTGPVSISSVSTHDELVADTSKLVPIHHTSNVDSAHHCLVTTCDHSLSGHFSNNSSSYLMFGLCNIEMNEFIIWAPFLCSTIMCVLH